MQRSHRKKLYSKKLKIGLQDNLKNYIAMIDSYVRIKRLPTLLGNLVSDAAL